MILSVKHILNTTTLIGGNSVASTITLARGGLMITSEDEEENHTYVLFR